MLTSRWRLFPAICNYPSLAQLTLCHACEFPDFFSTLSNVLYLPLLAFSRRLICNCCRPSLICIVHHIWSSHLNFFFLVWTIISVTKVRSLINTAVLLSLNDMPTFYVESLVDCFASFFANPSFFPFLSAGRVHWFQAGGHDLLMPALCGLSQQDSFVNLFPVAPLTCE